MIKYYQEQIELEINNCEQCPFYVTNKVYTEDSFDDARKVFCNKLEKNVHSYLDWNEIAQIPKECPLRNK
jgi:hypothetical protein